MMIKASGRSALIVAAGLVVCFAGPLPARAAGGDSAAASKTETSTSGKSVRHSTRHWKRYAHRKYTRTAAKSTESGKAAEREVADASDSTPFAIPASVAIPSLVANANAQMTSTGALADSASAMTAKANTVLLASADKPADAQAPADAAVVASDQLNDVDKALQETPPKQQTVALAVVRPTSTSPVKAATDDSNAWDQTSLIGKVFIGFGALLTMASAARMFMA
jgi:hypothetical protein